MRYKYEFAGKIYEITLERHGSSYRAVMDGEVFDLEILGAQPGLLQLRFGDRIRTVYYAADGEQKWISSQGCAYRLDRPASPRSRPGGASAGEDSLRAPMPAQVGLIQVSPGDTAAQGQTLLILEAMKMEIRIQAPRNSKIARILVQPGETVSRDQVLIELERKNEG